MGKYRIWLCVSDAKTGKSKSKTFDSDITPIALFEAISKQYVSAKEEKVEDEDEVEEEDEEEE